MIKYLHISLWQTFLLYNMKYCDICSPPDSADTLWYYPNINRFTDECGYVLHDLQPYFDVWQLDEWKKTKDYALMTDKQGGLWELYYLEEEECNHNCDICQNKCEIYTLIKDYEKERSYICDY